MPGYGSLAAPINLSPGQQVILFNSATDGVSLTATMAIAVEQASALRNLWIFNTTTQSCTIQAAAVDAAGSYLPIGSGVTIAAGQCGYLPVVPALFRANFAVSPTSGLLIAAL